MIHDKGPINYDGMLLKQKFGYDFYQEKYNPNGVIVIAYGPMNIGYDGIYFLNDYPTFEDAIHICWEIPNLNLKGNSFFKQIFTLKIYEEIKNLNKIDKLCLTEDYSINMEDSLSLNLNKVTDGGTVLGYIGLNNSVLNLLEKDKTEFSEKIEKHFYSLTQLSFIDTIKTT
jgi:hypothetical protein